MVSPTAKTATSSKEHVAKQRNMSMSDQFTLDVDQASELKHAAKRNGVNNADLKALSSGDMFAKIIPVLRGYGQFVVKLLRHVGDIAFPGTPEFVASKHFLKDATSTVRVKIADIDEEFSEHFLNKVEQGVPSRVLKYSDLLSDDGEDISILFHLGGKDKAEVSLAEIFYLLLLQPNGEKGALLTTSNANIFYARDFLEGFRVVSVDWTDDGWLVSSFEIWNSMGWSEGARVFSPK